MKQFPLRELRNKRKLSQRELAKIVDLSPSAIAMYEIGRRKPKLSIALKIAKFFGVTVEVIFFGKKTHDMRVVG